VFVEHSSIATDIFLDHAKSGKSIDAQQLMFNFTMDGIGQIGFGQKFGNLEGLKTGGVQFGKSFDVAVALSTQRYINPGWSFMRVLGLSKDEKLLEKAVCQLNAFSQSVITARREEYAQKGLSGKHDILSLFLKYEEKEVIAPAEKGRITDTFLRDVVLNMIIAGRDTTACTLTWAFYVLGTNPELQERLAIEISDTLKGEQPNYDNTKEKNLPLVNGFLMEVLRLW
jgi:cytochrome P450